MRRDVTISDVFVFTGLPLTGVGLFFWFGLGVALTVTGALVLLIGIAANVAEARK